MNSKENMELDCQIGKVRASRNSALIASAINITILGSMVGMIYFGGKQDLATAVMTSGLQLVGSGAAIYTINDFFKNQQQLNDLYQQKVKSKEKK